MPVHSMRPHRLYMSIQYLLPHDTMIIWTRTSKQTKQWERANKRPVLFWVPHLYVFMFLACSVCFFCFYVLSCSFKLPFYYSSYFYIILSLVHPPNLSPHPLNLFNSALTYLPPVDWGYTRGKVATESQILHQV